MSAITGLLNIKGGEPFDHQTMHDMYAAVEVQKHRGPDEQGVCAFGYKKQKSYVASDALGLRLDKPMDGIIGYNGLNTRGISTSTRQPLTALDGKVILAYDGKIFNGKELKNDLLARGYTIYNTSDAEIIMMLYLEFGFDDMVRRLNGTFAMVLVDLREGRTFIAGDRFGAKPLYYTFYNGRFAFASELKGIIQLSDFERKIDMNAFNARLVFARPGSKVLLEGVFLLKPGQIITISSDGETKTWQYFNLDVYNRDNTRFKSIDEAIEVADKILGDTVLRQLKTGAKVGIQLSGGIDSTLVAHYAKKLGLDNFTEAVAIVDGTGDLGEEKYIDYVGNSLNLNVHKFTMTPDYFLRNCERMVWHNDAPVYKPYFVCFMKLGELAKDYVSVLFCGEGSDEIAGGYSRFAAGVYWPFIAKMGLAGGNVKSYDSYARYAAMAGETITDLLSNDWTSADELIQERVDLFSSFKGSDLTKHLKFEIVECLPEASLRQDKMTMASSIENRVPLLDNEFVDFVMQLPEDMLVRFVNHSPVNLSSNPFEWVQGKYIFKEMVAKQFGHDFAYRKKMIMNLDERTMITSNGFKEYYYDAIYPRMKSRGIIDANRLNTWFANAGTISNKEFTSMWRAISLEIWCQLFMDTNRSSMTKK